jgi:oligopeptidase B
VPPLAPRLPHVVSAPGGDRTDDWYWLREREDPEVIAYLEAENAHTEEVLAPTKGLQQQLFEEFRGRILETDLSVPARKGEWWYYTRTVEGLQYPIVCRKPGSLEADEQIVLDQNELAGNSDYFAVGAMAVSPDGRLLAYSTDYDGDEEYVLKVRDLATGDDLSDEIPGTYYGAEWAADNATIFYTTLDDARRPHRLMRHRLRTEPGDDDLLYQEDDETFWLSIDKTRSEKFLVMTLESKVTTEEWILRSSDALGSFRVVQPREAGVEYEVEHAGNRFYVVTNAEGAVNFKLMEAPLDDPGRAQWVEVIGHRDDVKLDDVEGFAEHLVLHERAGGATRISVMRLSDGEVHVVDQPEQVSHVDSGQNLEFDTATYRYTYTSLVTPNSVFDYEMDERHRELRKQQPVLGDYDPARYETGRLWATAEDGEQVPISYVRPKGAPTDGTAPCLLYGYGSYEHSVDPYFSPFRLSLLERGFTFAIAHIRGGGEMGRRWYENGKLAAKRNTFTDFVACAQHLVDSGFTSPPRLAIRGGSAGGLLMGAVVNLRPESFGAVVAEVPFVDVVTTMLDEEIPLTVTEWEEWGDPRQPDVYEYMLSYSPDDNVAAVDYPPMLVTAGLNDPRVQYWEPAKWVAKLRATKTGHAPLLLKTEMGAGHGGPSGRYDAWKDEALVQAFLLWALGLADGG